MLMISKMKFSILLSISLSVLLTGCFFSSNKMQTAKDNLIIDKNAPYWLNDSKVIGYITQIGVAKNIDKKRFSFNRQKALLDARYKLTRKLYIKTQDIYNTYEKENDNKSSFDKDIKNISQQVSLQSIKKSKVINSWLSPNNTLYIQVSIKSSIVAKNIQKKSKSLFNKNKGLYTNFLSNEAFIKISKRLEY